MRLRVPFTMLGIGLAVLFGLLTLLRSQGYLQFLELAVYDLLVATATRDSASGSQVVLVDITEADIRNLGNWPLSDEQLAEVLYKLLAVDPRIVGLDFYRDLPVPPGNDSLNRLLHADARIVAIEKFPGDGDSGVAPPPALEGTARVGFSDLVSDAGGVIRRNLLFQSGQGRVAYSFGLRLALAFLAQDGIQPLPGTLDPAVMRLGDVDFVPLAPDFGGYANADTAGYQVMLDYIGGPSPFLRFSLNDLLADRIEADRLRDRIVILGSAAESVKDLFPVPHAILDGVAGTVSGSTLHAHSARQLIEAAFNGRRPLTVWPDAVENAWILLWAGLGMLAGWLFASAARLVLLLLAGSVAIILISLLAFHSGWWIPVVAPSLGFLIGAAMGTALLAAHRRREQKVLTELFVRQVSPDVARTIWDRRDEVLRDGRINPQQLTATVLFADMQGFTAISEAVEAEPFLDWLNCYMSPLTDTVMRYGGFLDDFAGDGIKANFGVPISRASEQCIAEDARNAVRCALAMGKELNRLNREWEARGHAAVAMRIGIHTGLMVAGTVGSPSRMKYTTVGSNVNLGARLEGMKEIRAPDPVDGVEACRVLVSEDTTRLLAGEFRLSPMGRFRLRGIQREVGVFLVESRLHEITNNESTNGQDANIEC